MGILGVLLLSVSIHTDFEAGSLGKVERLSETHFRCAVKGESDQDQRNRQANWYYFRVDGVAGREITIDLVDLVGEYDYRPGSHAVTEGTRPFYSYDRQTWTAFREVEWDAKDISLRLRFTPSSNRVWIAHVPPYTTRDLARLLNGFRRHPHLKKELVGKTVHGRDMLLLTVTNPAAPDANKKVVWLMARQHAWETGASWVSEGALRFLLSSDPLAARIRDEVIFKIFPMADPDGVARGGVRFNAYGYDLNRNWDAVDPQKMPEIAAQRKAVLDWVDSGQRVDLFLSLHNTEKADYLEGPFFGVDSEFRRLAERFYHLLMETTTFNPTGPLRDSGPTTTAGKPGRMTVYQGLFHDRKIPALLMEQMVEYNSKLGRVPTIEDRTQFGAALVRALWAATVPLKPQLSAARKDSACGSLSVSPTN
jgi:murein tripeptide amidase MpaA